MSRTSNNLTDEQKSAIINTNGFYCVLASAGSGKTKTFAERIAKMVKDGIKPINILAVTFTKKASEEMRDRLEELIGEVKAGKITIGTFHAIAYRLLKSSDDDFDKLSIAPDWWIIQKLNNLCKTRDDKKNPTGLGLGIKAGELASFISYQKANLVTPNGKYVIDDRVYFVKAVPEHLLKKAYVAFEKLKEESRYVTFDDILVRFHNKLNDDTEFRSEVNEKFQYILVDEFQDTSTLMLEIIKLINDKNIFVVGDWRQSIYSFINANVDNIISFKDVFKDTNLVELSKNFRSTQRIVALSNKIISNSPVTKYQDFKASESVSEIGEPVLFSAYTNEEIQAKEIANKIINLSNEGVPLSQIAVEVRTNSQMAMFEQVFSDMDIPFDTSKSASFFDRREILDLMSYARLVVDSDDDDSLRRIINTPNRYLSNQFAEELERYAGSKDISLMKALRTTPQRSEWKFRNGIESLIGIISDLNYQTNINAGKFFRNAIKATGYTRHIEENAASSTSLSDALEAIEKLCTMASKFNSVRDFVNYVSVLQDKKKKSKNKESVIITTIHSAKGLEWDIVFVASVNQELLPHKMNLDIEEERRLFYVATSRPRKRLFISWFAIDNDEIKRESIFIRELLGEQLIKNMNNSVLSGSLEHSYEYKD